MVFCFMENGRKLEKYYRRDKEWFRIDCIQDCLEDFHNIMQIKYGTVRSKLYMRGRRRRKAPELDIFHTFCDSAADMQALGTRYLFKVGAQEPTYILSVSGDSKIFTPWDSLQ